MRFSSRKDADKELRLSYVEARPSSSTYLANVFKSRTSHHATECSIRCDMHGGRLCSLSRRHPGFLGMLQVC